MGPILAHDAGELHVRHGDAPPDAPGHTQPSDTAAYVSGE